MRFRSAEALCVLCFLAVLCASCGGGGLFRQYEYEEELYLALDGTATVYVNSSVAALNALRGTSFDTSPSATLDRERVRAYFSGPNTHVTWVRPSRRNGRRYIHVRLDVDDVRKLGEQAAFAWSAYRFNRDDDVFAYEQVVGSAVGKPVENTNWSGRELVAFRLHLPSKIEYHNTLPANHKRGNILVWEQSLTDRLRGVPLTLDARMQTQSILYRTLWLFAATFLAVAVGFALIVWWVLRRGSADPQTSGSTPA